MSQSTTFSFSRLTDHSLQESNAQVDPNTQEATEDTKYLQSLYEYLEKITKSVPQTSGYLQKFQSRLKFLSKLLQNPRYPRLAIIGRRGSGKSSLLNALLGQKVSTPGHVQAQTGTAKLLQYRVEGDVGFDVLDTRGLNEGSNPLEEDESKSAIDSVVTALETFPVDCILFVHKITEVDAGVQADFGAFKTVLEKSHIGRVPIIVVLTHVDELEPSDLKKPADYDDEKLALIAESKSKFLKNLLEFDAALSELVVACVAVSCFIVWLPETDDKPVLPNPKRDYRYNIDELMDTLLRNVQTQALFKTVQASRALGVKRDFAVFLTKCFAGIGGIISLSPIPTSDMIPITLLITYLTYTIHTISPPSPNRTPSTFMGVIGLNTILTASSRYFVSQLLKFTTPGTGSIASACVSYSVCLGCGYAAIAYFLDGTSDKEVREVFEGVRNADYSGEVGELANDAKDSGKVKGE